MHGAPYVSDEFVKAKGRLGRSWGCPAIRAEVAQQMIDRVKGGGLVFAYYPDAGGSRRRSISGAAGHNGIQRALELRER